MSIEIVIVGDGDRAAQFRALVEKSPRTTLAAVVPHEALTSALGRYPDARFVIALPPRAALRAALELAAAGRAGVVEAPLPLSAADLTLPESAVQAAHGWVTLRREWIERVLARSVSTVEVLVEGLPEQPGGDLQEVVVHALALVRRLFPEAEPLSARVDREDTLAADFRVPAGPSVTLTAHAFGQRVEVRAIGDGFQASWGWQPDEETRQVYGPKSSVKSLPCPNGTARALTQLVDPEHHGGDTLRDAGVVLALARRTLALLPRPLVIGQRPFRQAVRRAERHPDDPLAPLGLSGKLEPGPRAPALELPRFDEPSELWLFRAGHKPVAFLTIEPDQVDATAAWFEGAHVETRQRRVASGPHDTWIDRRDLGVPRVELYISRDAELARRAAELQAQTDPSSASLELGKLMGYPACCVEAFAKLVNRSNNSQNRYATAQHTRPGRWPWQLNNFLMMLLPFFPCRYDCPAALSLARAVLDELDRAHPGACARLEQILSRPLVYFTDQHALCFDGTYRDGVIEYSGVAVAEGAPPGFRRLAAMVAAADGLAFDDHALRLFRGGAAWTSLERTDPGLGLLVDFGGTEAR